MIMMIMMMMVMMMITNDDDYDDDDYDNDSDSDNDDDDNDDIDNDDIDNNDDGSIPSKNGWSIISCAPLAPSRLVPSLLRRPFKKSIVTGSKKSYGGSISRTSGNIISISSCNCGDDVS